MVDDICNTEGLKMKKTLLPWPAIFLLLLCVQLCLDLMIACTSICTLCSFLSYFLFDRSKSLKPRCKEGGKWFVWHVILQQIKLRTFQSGSQYLAVTEAILVDQLMCKYRVYHYGGLLHKCLLLPPATICFSFWKSSNFTFKTFLVQRVVYFDGLSWNRCG